MKILAFGSNLPFENNSTKENIESAYKALSQFNINILKNLFLSIRSLPK